MSAFELIGETSMTLRSVTALLSKAKVIHDFEFEFVEVLITLLLLPSKSHSELTGKV